MVVTQLLDRFRMLDVLGCKLLLLLVFEFVKDFVKPLYFLVVILYLNLHLALSLLVLYYVGLVYKILLPQTFVFHSYLLIALFQSVDLGSCLFTAHLVLILVGFHFKMLFLEVKHLLLEVVVLSVDVF